LQRDAQERARKRAEREVHVINAELEKRVQERIAQLEAAIHGFSRILMNECTPQLSERTKHYLEDLPTFSLVAQALGDLRAETGPSVEIAVSGLPPCQGARNYQLQATTDLSSSVWTTLTNLPTVTTNGAGLFTVTTTNSASSFYRLWAYIIP